MSKKILIMATLLVGFVGLSNVACSELFPVGTWRYKITINVTTPEGPKSGSSVREVSMGAPLVDLPEASTKRKYSGEAVNIDFGQHGILFALISYDSYREVFDAFPMRGPATAEGIKYYRSLKPGTKASLPPKNWPRFVYFTDISDPKTVHEVYPTKIVESFGPGFEIRDITIEITDQPVTTGIEKLLPWLASHKTGYLDGKSLGGGPALSNILHYGFFKQENS